MTVQTALRFAAAALVAVLATACGSAPQALPETPPPASQSVAQADQRLAAVARERAGIEARYAEREQACYQKFFVNNCLDEAGERRRLALSAQRAIEIEAARYKRQAAVDARDRDIARAEKEYAVEEARLVAQPAPVRAATEPPPARPEPVARRLARHDEKVKQAAAREAARAGKRAASVAAYERRKRESDERQKEVAARLAEKAAKNQQPAR